MMHTHISLSAFVSDCMVLQASGIDNAGGDQGQLFKIIPAY
jgi:hypothetical protein